MKMRNSILRRLFTQQRAANLVENSLVIALVMVTATTAVNGVAGRSPLGGGTESSGINGHFYAAYACMGNPANCGGVVAGRPAAANGAGNSDGGFCVEGGGSSTTHCGDDNNIRIGDGGGERGDGDLGDVGFERPVGFE
ncbi:MAG: hypothetical protein K1X83_10230 [Oligoflexia bacterium]|nr:hypothetical protein [Oligoflexia bacterium]